ncbi:MAG: general secretion pathway protein J [Gammaproteobacteria bacterium]
MTARANGRGRGFTLIEVVVSIALFALLMGVVYSGFSTAVRAYDAAESRVGKIERMRVISAFIRRSVSGAQALALANRDKWALQFEGEGDRIRYVADLPGYVGISGLHEIVLELEPSGDQRDLVMRRRVLSMGRDGQVQGDFDTRVLAEGIEIFSLRFYGANEGAAEPTWQDSWQSVKHMPLLVELSVTASGEPPWPLLQVQPRVDAIRYVRSSAAVATQPAPPGAAVPDGSPNPGSESESEPEPEPASQ